MKLKNKIHKIIVLIILFIISLNTNIYATEIEKGEYSKRYEEWLELDEEERKNTIAPLPINIRATKTSGISSLRTILKSSTIPSTFDLRKNKKIDIEIKNQMNTGLCWGFSANTALETYLALNNKIYNFSERHIEYDTANNYLDGKNQNSLNRNLGDGGDMMTAFTYYSRGSGPILEEDMPFENNENTIKREDLPINVTVQKVDDMVYFPSIYKRIENGTIIYEDASRVPYTTNEVTQIRYKIKEHIMNYGGITVSINADQNHLNRTTWADNLNENNVYPNHAVTIIGWDDTYSKDNFLSKYKPTTDGAYIVLNSWGNSWGDNGVYYISYEDFLVESQMRGVTSVSDVQYDNLYQHDVGEMYAWINSKYAANVFTSKENEKLTEVMVGTWKEQTCNVYVNSSGKDLNISNLTQIASNVTLEPGYNTIEVNNNISIAKGSQFSIVVELTGEYSGIGIENYSELFPNVVSNAQESYASSNGTSWTDLYDKNDMMNFCIKAYTQADEKNIEIGEIKGTVEKGVGGTIKFPISTTYEAKGDKAQIKIFKDNQDVTSDFTISGNTIRGNGAYISIKCPSNIKDGQYNIQITLSDICTITKNITFFEEQIELPKQVTGFKVKSQTTSTINLTWSKATGATGYSVYSFNYKKNKWEYVGTTSKTSYTIKKLKAGTTYRYRVRAYKTVDGTQYFGSYATSIKTSTKTSTPKISKITSKSKKATIRWNKVSGASGYEIYMSTSKNGKYSKIKTINKSSTVSYTKSSLKKNKTYYFKIRTYKTVDGKKIYSSYSSVKSIKIK